MLRHTARPVKNFFRLILAMDLDKNETPIDNCSYPICVKKSPMSRLIERGIPAPVMIARILAVALLGLSLKGQQSSR